MRAFTQNLAVKIVSFILLVFLIFSLYVSVVGICGLISMSHTCIVIMEYLWLKII